MFSARLVGDSRPALQQVAAKGHACAWLTQHCCPSATTTYAVHFLVHVRLDSLSHSNCLWPRK